MASTQLVILSSTLSFTFLNYCPLKAKLLSCCHSMCLLWRLKNAFQRLGFAFLACLFQFVALEFSLMLVLGACKY